MSELITELQTLNHTLSTISFMITGIAAILFFMLIAKDMGGKK